MTDDRFAERPDDADFTIPDAPPEPPLPPPPPRGRRSAVARALDITHRVPAEPDASTAYAAALDVAAWIHHHAAGKDWLDLLPVRSAVRGLTDVLLSSDRRLMTYTALRPPEFPALSHAVNVAVLSLAVGLRLGLDRTLLLRLGVAAFLHDIGKVEVPKHVLLRCAPYGEAERAELNRHNRLGARALMRVAGVPGDALDAMLVAFEHHRAFGEETVPGKLPAAPLRPSPPSRVVAVCDFYDSALTHRSFHARPLFARETLERMVARRGQEFDPAAVDLLVETVGCYPAGTTVRLNDGRTAVVTAPGIIDPTRPVLVVPGPVKSAPVATIDMADQSDIEIEGFLEDWSTGIDGQQLLRAWIEAQGMSRAQVGAPPQGATPLQERKAA